VVRPDRKYLLLQAAKVGASASFGKISATMVNPRRIQVAARWDFLR